MKTISLLLSVIVFSLTLNSFVGQLDYVQEFNTIIVMLMEVVLMLICIVNLLIHKSFLGKGINQIKLFFISNLKLEVKKGFSFPVFKHQKQIQTI